MVVGSSSSPLLSSSSLPQQPPLLPTPQLSAHLAMTNHSRNRGRYRGNWRPSNIRFQATLLQTGGRISGRTGTPLLQISGRIRGSGLDMYAAKYVPILAIQLFNALSFAAAHNSPLLTLLLRMILLQRLGFPTPARINM